MPDVVTGIFAALISFFPFPILAPTPLFRFGVLRTMLVSFLGAWIFCLGLMRPLGLALRGYGSSSRGSSPWIRLKGEGNVPLSWKKNNLEDHLCELYLFFHHVIKLFHLLGLTLFDLSAKLR